MLHGIAAGNVMSKANDAEGVGESEAKDGEAKQRGRGWVRGIGRGEKVLQWACDQQDFFFVRDGCGAQILLQIIAILLQELCGHSEVQGACLGSLQNYKLGSEVVIPSALKFEMCYCHG
jgi:hypothetical protein